MKEFRQDWQTPKSSSSRLPSRPVPCCGQRRTSTRARPTCGDAPFRIAIESLCAPAGMHETQRARHDSGSVHPASAVLALGVGIMSVSAAPQQDTLAQDSRRGSARCIPR